MSFCRRVRCGSSQWTSVSFDGCLCAIGNRHDDEPGILGAPRAHGCPKRLAGVVMTAWCWCTSPRLHSGSTWRSYGTRKGARDRSAGNACCRTDGFSSSSTRAGTRSDSPQPRSPACERGVSSSNRRRRVRCWVCCSGRAALAPSSMLRRMSSGTGQCRSIWYGVPRLCCERLCERLIKRSVENLLSRAFKPYLAA